MKKINHEWIVHIHWNSHIYKFIHIQSFACIVVLWWILRFEFISSTLFYVLKCYRCSKRDLSKHCSSLKFNRRFINKRVFKRFVHLELSFSYHTYYRWHINIQDSCKSVFLMLSNRTLFNTCIFENARNDCCNLCITSHYTKYHRLLPLCVPL